MERLRQPTERGTFTTELPGEVYAALGRLTVHFNLMEQLLGVVIAGLAEADPRVMGSVLARVTARQRIAILESLIREKAPASLLEADIRTLITDLNEATDRRNTWVHGALFGDASGAKQLRASNVPKKGYVMDLREVDAQAIETDSTFVSQMAFDLSWYAGRLASLQARAKHQSGGGSE
jgi:hypothetical protein